MSARRSYVWLALAIVIAVAACVEPPPETLYWEDFEALCEGTPCGWERVAGEPDQATWIETIHPGEHGLRLTDEITVRGPAGEIVETPVDAAALNVNLLARCDSSSSLQVNVVVLDALGGTFAATATADPSDAWQADWQTRNLVALTWEDEMPANVVRVSAITIRKAGAGACEISSLVLTTGNIRQGC